MPAALLDRFAFRVHVDEPHPEALARLSPDMRERARTTAMLGHERRISLRGWMAFDMLRAERGEQLAAELVFADRADDVLDAPRIGADRPRSATATASSCSMPDYDPLPLPDRLDTASTLLALHGTPDGARLRDLTSGTKLPTLVERIWRETVGREPRPSSGSDHAAPDRAGTPAGKGRGWATRRASIATAAGGALRTRSAGGFRAAS